MWYIEDETDKLHIFSQFGGLEGTQPNFKDALVAAKNVAAKIGHGGVAYIRSRYDLYVVNAHGHFWPAQSIPDCGRIAADVPAFERMVDDGRGFVLAARPDRGGYSTGRAWRDEDTGDFMVRWEEGDIGAFNPEILPVALFSRRGDAHEAWVAAAVHQRRPF